MIVTYILHPTLCLLEDLLTMLGAHLALHPHDAWVHSACLALRCSKNHAIKYLGPYCCCMFFRTDLMQICICRIWTGYLPSLRWRWPSGELIWRRQKSCSCHGMGHLEKDTETETARTFCSHLSDQNKLRWYPQQPQRFIKFYSPR